MSTNNNDIRSQEICQSLLELIYYIVISARKLIEEPKYYGPLRMLEIASRLLNILDVGNIKSPINTIDFIMQIENTKNSIIEGEEYFVANLDNLVDEIILVLTEEEDK